MDRDDSFADPTTPTSPETIGDPDLPGSERDEFDGEELGFDDEEELDAQAVCATAGYIGELPIPQGCAERENRVTRRQMVYVRLRRDRRQTPRYRLSSASLTAVALYRDSGK